jgi:uncharacterized membrane protein
MRRPRRILRGHLMTFAAMAVAAATYLLTIPTLRDPVRTTLAWDVFDLVFLVLATVMMVRAAPADMPAQACAQEEGEWSIFTIVVLGVTVSFLALVGEFSGVKDKDQLTRDLTVILVVATLLLSWLTMQVVFALRYAHEYYTATTGQVVDKGLEFPSEEEPDYWDFVYFAFVLGMTFQVSDVQITSRKLRRLATAHGMLGFLFNTIIVALTVNLAANLL